MEFKVGDKVKIISSENNSINKVGDVGIIVEYDLDLHDGLDYKVLVDGRKVTLTGQENTANWHKETELELIQEKEVED
jgi:hypothetical protein